MEEKDEEQEEEEEGEKQGKTERKRESDINSKEETLKQRKGNSVGRL